MAIAGILVIILYIMYIMGYLPVSVKRARSFVGNMGFGGQRCTAVFTGCTGHIHRCVRFRESRSYGFNFSLRLREGDVTMELLDSRRSPILVLDHSNPTGVVNVEKGKRYYLYIRFRNAGGDLQLDWR